MNDLIYTRHAEPRTQQRAIRKRDRVLHKGLEDNTLF